MTKDGAASGRNRDVQKKPKVSIVTISYNQEKYIREALEGFVAQQVDFDFEIIVADDASTDGTQKIIKSYVNKYPHLFRPILRKKNIGAVSNSIEALKAATGTYIALCEGDDYWTDPKKLQLQADFLDDHPDHALCFHPVRVFFENKEEKDALYPEVQTASAFTVDELLRWNFIQTNSVMYRRQAYDKIPTNILPLDWYLHLYHAQFGKIGFINRVMAAYRRHAGGIWWQSYADRDAMWVRHGLVHINTYIELQKLYGQNKERRAILDEAIANALQAFLAVDKKQQSQLFKSIMAAHPEAVETFISHKLHVLEEKEEALRKKEDDIQSLFKLLEHKDTLIQGKDGLIQEKEQMIQSIKASKIWKARNRVAKLTGKRII